MPYHRVTAEQLIDLWRIGALSADEAIAGLKYLRWRVFAPERIDALLAELSVEIEARLDDTNMNGIA